MIKSKSTFYKILIVGAILFAFYFIASVFESEFWCNILSPLNAGTATGVLIYAYINSDHRSLVSMVLPIYSFACFSWTVGDILWAISSFSGANPTKNLFISFMYMLTNVFIATAVLKFLFCQFNKWDSFQLLLDTLVISFSSVMLIWIVFFNKSNAWIKILSQDGIVSTFLIILDFLVIIGELIYWFSARKGKIPAYIYCFGLGILLYSVNDLHYFYTYANSTYILNSLTDSFYIFALLLIAFGALWSTFADTHESREDFSNIGYSLKWILLFFFPLTAFMNEGFVIADIVIYFLVVVIYGILSAQVQLAIRNGELYQKELNLNSILEKRVEEQFSELKFLANHDTVTKLHNRRFFMNSLDESIETLPTHEVLAVFLIDVDRFKIINDSLGHDVGDEVLIEISSRMLNCNNGAILARLGGDEFALLFRGKYTHKDLSEFAEQIIESCGAPIMIGEHILRVTISLGISIFLTDANDRKTLIRNADIAMYRAKSQGFNKYGFFDPFFKESDEKKSEIEVLLRNANIEKDFELFYQPQFSLPDNKIIGAEALICWNNTEHGYITPNEFIPVAEEINFIIKMGKWVMFEAIKQIIKWNTTYSLDLKMGINISPKELKEDDFISTLKTLISDEHFKTTWIDMEITENIMIEDGSKVNAIFDLFKELSVSVSIDDFGSGYSSWGYLNKYPFDRIKIDKTLIEQVSLNNSKGIQVVKAVISMANAIGVKTIAEGVETQEQLDILMGLDCNQVQGFLLGRPVSASVFEEVFIKSMIA